VKQFNSRGEKGLDHHGVSYTHCGQARQERAHQSHTCMVWSSRRPDRIGHRHNTCAELYMTLRQVIDMYSVSKVSHHVYVKCRFKEAHVACVAPLQDMEAVEILARR
jgi:hypothetical protein